MGGFIDAGESLGLSRRDFLGIGALTLGTGFAVPQPVRRLSDRVRDPRLTARPHDPTLTAVPGATPVPEELGGTGVLYVPRGYRAESPVPLLVALHGGGGSAGFWSRLYTVCENRGLVMLAPEARARTWDGVHGMMGPDVQFIDAALAYVFDRCNILKDRIALSGFSDGASYALSLGPSNGDLFSHLIAFSPGFSTPEEPIVGAPAVFVSHGSRDRTLPVAMSRDVIVPMFEMDGYRIRYEEFDGGHEMPPEIVARALDWFLDS